MIKIEKEVAKILLKIKAVTLRPKDPYLWVSGLKAPIYCDNRMLMSYPEERKKIVDFFVDVIEKNNLQFDVIAGVATSGIYWAALVAERLNKPAIYVRKKAKDYGRENRIEGELKKGQKVLIIEDLISTGGSSFNAVEGAREQGGVVEECIAIFTYEMEKSKKTFEQGKCGLITLSNFSTLVKIAEEEKYINEEEKEVALAWSSDPFEWGAKHGF